MLYLPLFVADLYSVALGNVSDVTLPLLGLSESIIDGQILSLDRLRRLLNHVLNEELAVAQLADFASDFVCPTASACTGKAVR